MSTLRIDQESHFPPLGPSPTIRRLSGGIRARSKRIAIPSGTRSGSRYPIETELLGPLFSQPRWCHSPSSDD